MQVNYMLDKLDLALIDAMPIEELDARIEDLPRFKKLVTDNIDNIKNKKSEKKMSEEKIRDSAVEKAHKDIFHDIFYLKKSEVMDIHGSKTFKTKKIKEIVVNANYMAGPFHKDPFDLVGTAYEKLSSGDRSWPRGVPEIAVYSMVMHSVLWDEHVVDERRNRILIDEAEAVYNFNQNNTDPLGQLVSKEALAKTRQDLNNENSKNALYVFDYLVHSPLGNCDVDSIREHLESKGAFDNETTVKQKHQDLTEEQKIKKKNQKIYYALNKIKKILKKNLIEELGP